MSAESAHLSTFGAETETEAEIRSTSTTDAAQVRQSYKICLFADTVCIMVHSNFRKDSSTTKVAIIMKHITINAVIKPVNSR